MKSKRTAITHEDVQRALAAFRQRGGSITRLPDQVQPAVAPIGLREQSWEVDLTAMTGGDAAPEAPHSVQQSLPAGN